MELKTDATAKAVVPVLACVLQQLCHRNDRLPLDQKYISKFHALRPPAIGILEYLERIAKYGGCSGECFVLALIYIDRIIQANPTFVVNSLNIHRLLITSIMLGAKFFDDQYFNNAYYAKVGGVPCGEVNALEVEFLFMCNFTLFVSTDTYKQYYTELCNHAMHSTCGCTVQAVPPLFIPNNLTQNVTYGPVEQQLQGYHPQMQYHMQQQQAYQQQQNYGPEQGGHMQVAYSQQQMQETEDEDMRDTNVDDDGVGIVTSPSAGVHVM